MNYLLLSDPTEEQMENMKEPITLKDMIYLFSYPDEITVDEEKGTKSKIIRSAYAAHDAEGNMYVFGTAFSTMNEEDIVLLGQSDYFSAGKLDRSELMINFFAGKIDWYPTDFVTTKTEVGEYMFRAIVSEDQYAQFIIPNRIKLGLEILYRSFSCRFLIDSVVNEANLWLTNDIGGKVVLGSYDITNYKIENVTRSLKKGKGVYTGATAIEFTSNANEKIVAVMAYHRSTKLRDKSTTMNLNLMEAVYKDAYTIAPFTGMSIGGNNEIRLFVYKKDDDNFTVLNLPLELHNKLTDEINKL